MVYDIYTLSVIDIVLESLHDTSEQINKEKMKAYKSLELDIK